ncbi:uncharacterized protein LOC124172753 [Ischnura elegans]|uniref:uncharacterized protein LOC124172753 n=1 Tax=Ischnura elegans TaxID=197161 RepID=UPI001ED8B20F|nr:uncharacterized protein LOC124172753 [Ischnura elegans]
MFVIGAVIPNGYNEDIKHEDSEDCRSDDVEFVGEVGGGGGGGDGEDSSGEKCVGELVFLTRESGSGEAVGERCLIRTVGPSTLPNERRGTAEECAAGVQLSSAAHQTASNGILTTHSSVPSAAGHGQPAPPCVPTVPSMPTAPSLPPFVPPTVPRIRRRTKKPQGGSNSGRCAKCERGCCDLNHGSDDEDDVWLSGPKRKRAALQRWYWELEKLRNKSEQEKDASNSGTASLPVDDAESELEGETRKDEQKGTGAAPKPRKKKPAASSAEGQWQGGMPKIVNVASAAQALSQMPKKLKKGTPSASHVGTANIASPGEKCVKVSRLAHESSTGISLVGKVGNTVCVKVSGDGAGGRSGALIKALKKINEEGKLKKIGSVSPQGKVGEAVRSAGTVRPNDKDPNGGGDGGMMGNVGNKMGGPAGGSSGMAPNVSGAAVLPGANVGNQRVVMVMKRTKGSESGDAEYKVACGLSRELVNVSLEFVPESEKGIGDAAKSATSGENRPPSVETIDLTASGEDRAPFVETIDLTTRSRVDSNVGFRDKVSVGGGNAGGNASIKDKMTATLKGYLKKVPEVLKAEECGFASKKINPVNAIHAEAKEVPSTTFPENRNVGNSEEKCCRKVGNGSGSSGSKDQRGHQGLENGPGPSHVALAGPSNVAVAGPSLWSGHGGVFGGTLRNSREDPSVSGTSFGARSMLTETKLGNTGNGSSTLELSDQTSIISGRTTVKVEDCEPDAGSGRIPSVQDCEAAASSNDMLEKCVKVEDNVDSACGSESGTILVSGKRKRGRPRKGSKEEMEGENTAAAASDALTAEVVGKKRGRPRGLPDGYKRSLDRQIDVFAGKLVYRSTRGRLVQQAKDTAPVYVEASGRILKDAPRRRRKKPPEPEAKAQETRRAAGKISPWSGERSCDTDSSEDVWEKEWDKLQREQPIRPSTGGCGLTRANLDAGLGSKCGATSKSKGSVSASKDGSGPSFSMEPVGSFSVFAGLISPDGIKKELEDDGVDVEGSVASSGANEGLASVLRENGVRAVGGVSVGSSLSDEKMGRSDSRGVVGTDERLAFEKVACKVERDSEVEDVAGAALEKFGSFSARSPVREDLSYHSSRATTMAADVEERCFAELEAREMNVKTESPYESHYRAGVDFKKVSLFSTSSCLSYDSKVDGSSASRTVLDKDGSVVPGFRTFEGEKGTGSSSEYHNRASTSVVEARSFCVSSFEGDNKREQGCAASKTVTNTDGKSNQGKETGVCDGEGRLPSGNGEGATGYSEEGMKAREESYGTFTATGRSMTRSNAGLPGRAAKENDGKEEAEQP